MYCLFVPMRTNDDVALLCWHAALHKTLLNLIPLVLLLLHVLRCSLVACDWMHHVCHHAASSGAYTPDSRMGVHHIRT
jgi:hypothetical protein